MTALSWTPVPQLTDRAENPPGPRVRRPARALLYWAAMSTLRSLLAAGALAGLSASLLVGCGCDPGNNSFRPPVQFTPSSVDAVRTPSTCGVTDPIFTPTDTFSLELTGETDVAPPFTDVRLDVGASVAPNEAVPLMVSQGDVTTAASTDGAIQFTYKTGSNPSELDDSPLASVVVTVTSVPASDGALLGAELSLTFEDGRVLDQVYSAPLTTQSIICAKP
jgi:hypothetical protein